MTDLLTKEERETVERAKALLADKWGYDIGEWVGVTGILLDTIDNLSKRGAKKYSKTEILQEWSIRSRPEGGYTTTAESVASRDAFLACARFLGALEEK